MKPPAFQFYADDFLAGTLGMSQAEVGAYILLLSAQWSRGQIPSDDDRLHRLAAGPVSADVLAKFPVADDGERRNLRMERERQKQSEFREKQSRKGAAGAVKRWQGHDSANGQTMAQASSGHPSGHPKIMAQASISQWPDDGSPSPSPSPSPYSLESTRAREEAGRPEVQRPSLAEVQTHADIIGLAPWKASDWFDEMEAGGWLDHAHRPVKKWQAMLTRVRTKWEADGRPKSPPTNNRGTGNGYNGNTRSSSAPNRNAGTINEGGHEQYRGVGEVG